MRNIWENFIVSTFIEEAGLSYVAMLFGKWTASLIYTSVEMSAHLESAKRKQTTTLC